MGPLGDPKTVFLAFDTETFTRATTAMDDPATNTSSLIGSSSVTVRFDHALLDTNQPREAILSDIEEAVASYLVPFNIEVTRERPANGEGCRSSATRQKLCDPQHLSQQDG